jgi:hypothetical protein
VSEDKPKREDFETFEEYLEEVEKNSSYIQAMKKWQAEEDRRAKFTLRYWLNKSWQAKAEFIAMQDPRYRELKAMDIEGRDDSCGTKELKVMAERYKLRHELAPQPQYMAFFRWKDDKKRHLYRRWHTFRFKTLRRRTDSPFWHFMHNEDWVCPDCDSLEWCRDTTPDHLCTGQIVDVDDLNEEGVDERDGVAWINKMICVHCGYKGKDAQRNERQRVRRRARH